MLTHLAWGTGLVLATVAIHIAATALVVRWLHRLNRQHWAFRGYVNSAFALGGIVLLLSMTAYLEAALWALAYLVIGVMPAFVDALYFSLVTFTTLGYGDVVLEGEWRTLAAFQAANGILMFGWSTAVIVAAATRLLGRGAEP